VRADNIVPPIPITPTLTSPPIDLMSPTDSQAAYKIYLPIIGKPAITELINGGFESGNTGWIVSSTNGRKVIRNEFGTTGVPMHGGAWGAWLGGLYNEQTAVQQAVKIYEGTSYLAYWHYIASADYCGYDRAYVKVNGAVIDQYDLCDANDTHGWVKRAINLAPYAGQTVTVRIEVRTDSSLNSNLFIDDLTFQSTAALPVTDETGANMTRDPLNTTRLESGESDYGMLKP
jgi:hypothetical protein